MLDPDLLERLRGAEGRELLQQAARLIDDPFAAARLRRDFPAAGAALAAAAVDQVRLRRGAAARFPEAGAMWFERSLLAQASSSVVAGHRARRFVGRSRVADLCCGLGADTVALARSAEVLAVDRDPLALALTGANAAVHGCESRVELLRASVPENVPLAGLSAAWADPARRAGDRRTRDLDRISPALGDLLTLRDRIPGLGIKLAPSTDWGELAALSSDGPQEIEVISVHGECKEAVLWMGDLVLAEGRRRATLLPGGAEMVGDPDPAEVAVGEAWSGWLLEPDGAVIRAGLVGTLAREVAGGLLDPRLAYLVLPQPATTPFGRLYRVDRPEPFSMGALGSRLRRLGAGDVVLKTRGSAVDPADLRRRLRGVLKLGMPGRAPVVFLTRLAGRAAMILGERVGAVDE